jgi:hypothetical protein
MRIAFCHDWEPEFEQELTWADGLAAAMKELATRHEVKGFCPALKCPPTLIPNPYLPIECVSDVTAAVQAFSPDAILVWGDRARPNMKPLAALGIPMYLLFSGGPTEDGDFHLFKHIFVENEVYRKQLSRFSNVSIAFGTNTDLFTPLPDQAKVFDVLFPATFAIWKRHRLWAQAVEGLKSCAVGYMYDTHEDQCWKDCEKAGALVLPHVSGKALRRLYAASKCVAITSNNDGGSQRTVLEAMSMNIPVIVNNESQKNIEYPVISANPDPRTFRHLIDNVQLVETRQWVLDNASHIIYAKQIETHLRG